MSPAELRAWLCFAVARVESLSTREWSPYYAGILYVVAAYWFLAFLMGWEE